MKKISLLDEALFASLEAQKAPNRFTDCPAAIWALIRWDNALFSAGVYRLAAQGEAAIWAESATITEDQWTAFTLAILLTRLPSYNADVFLKLSQAKTFEDRRAIRKEAGGGVHSLTKLKEYHLHVAKQYGKKVIEEAETRAREADRELDKKAKLAMIKLADTNPAMMAQQAAPATKARRRGEVTQKEAAKICGVSVPTIRNWEAGKYTPEGWPGRDEIVKLGLFAQGLKSTNFFKQRVGKAIRYGDMDAVSHRVERGGRR